MKSITTKFKLVAASLVLTFGLNCLGQQFSSGSDGSEGELLVPSDTTRTLPLREDGIFRFTTITVQRNGGLNFTKNSLNTPVYLLATGDVVIDRGGVVDVAAHRTQGGPGGFDGGAGDGQGPGGGINGAPGVYAISHPQNGNVYGNPRLIPLIGGSSASGGPNTGGGGGGGGAILIASSASVVINGLIDASGSGNQLHPWSGSGGAIRIVATNVSGSGVLSCLGPGNGVDGRIRIDSLDRFAGHRTLTFQGVFTRGYNMVVFPENLPRLDILEAAGTTIPEGTKTRVSVQLPIGGSTNQTVQVQARNFTNDVPIRVAVTPAAGLGSTAFFDNFIALASGNPTKVTVPIVLPQDTLCFIYVWTR